MWVLKANLSNSVNFNHFVTVDGQCLFLNFSLQNEKTLAGPAPHPNHNPSWISLMWKMLPLSGRGQTWTQIFITCAETRWRQSICHRACHRSNTRSTWKAGLSSQREPWPLPVFTAAGSACVKAARRLNDPHLAPPGSHRSGLFLETFAFINISARWLWWY